MLSRLTFLPPALGITGGSLSSLERYAKEWLIKKFCEKKGGSPCDCSSCHWIKEENHPDCWFIRPEGSSRFIRIDQARALREEAGKPPYYASFRFFTLLPAHALTLEAGNALLKIIEEPPPTTHFLFLTPQPKLLLPTLRSRIPFFPVIQERREEQIPLTSLPSKGTDLVEALKFIKELSQQPWEAIPYLLVEGYKQTGDRRWLNLAFTVAQWQSETRATFQVSLLLEGLFLDGWSSQEI